MSQNEKVKSVTESDYLSIIKNVEELIVAKATLAINGAEDTKKSEKKYESLLLLVVEIIDSLDRIFMNIESRNLELDKTTRIWLNNFKAVRRKAERDLSRLGVTPIESINCIADPGYHTIVDTIETTDVDDNTILEEAKKGYLFNGKILRKAEVVVVDNT